MTIIPATAGHVSAELASLSAFAVLIGAVVPASWPPGEYDEGAQRFFLECLETAGAAGIGWYGWYAVRNEDADTPATVIAGGGYFGPPTEDGVVEIGYSVCPEWRGQGYATELVTALTAHALEHEGVTLVIAHTSSANPTSVRVLERSGFAAAGSGAEPDTLRFEYGPRA